MAIPTRTKNLVDDHPVPDGWMSIGYCSGNIANVLFCFLNEEYWLYAV